MPSFFKNRSFDMYVYKDLVTDEKCRDKKSAVIRKIRMNAGLVGIYLICLASGRDTFDIIDCSNLKQRKYPKKDLYILGIAEGKDNAVELAARLFVTFSAIYGREQFKQQLLNHQDTLFRRY